MIFCFVIKDGVALDKEVDSNIIFLLDKLIKSPS